MQNNSPMEIKKQKSKIHDRKGKRGIKIYFGIVILTVALNIAAWNSTAFSDWYIANIFPIWLNTYGRITGIFPFSVGEWLIVAAVVLVVLAVLLGLVWVCIGVFRAVKWAPSRGGILKGARKAEIARGEKFLAQPTVHGKREELADIPGRTYTAGLAKAAGAETFVENEGDEAAQLSVRKSMGFRNFTRGFYRFFAWTVLGVCLIMTLNCYILYHASTFSEHYFGQDNGEYDLVELIELYNMVAEKCNSYAKTVDRDENGVPVYKVNGVEQDLTAMADMARENMQKLGETYPQLDGYYPRPKALISSDFMCQQYMCGYYFPFSLEANYNDVMYLLNIPSTMCHELAHLRGYIFEDEANFISYLACTQSEHEFFQYAGYINVLVYLNNDLYKAWQQSRTAYDAAVAIVKPIAVDEQVWVDNTFVTDEEWERINGKAILDTEVVEEAADVFVDTNLKVNGVTDGAVSYSRVVRLLMQYHRSTEEQ